MSHIETAERIAGDPAPRAIARPGLRRRAMASVVVAGLVVAAGSGWILLQPPVAPTTAAVPAAPPEVDVSTPLLRDVARTTDFTGQFSAVDQVDLRAQVSGYLTEIHFTDGQVVRQGDLLFVIDPRPYEIALQRATAQYQSAVTALDLADKQVTRTTELVRNSFASREVLDQRLQTQKSAAAAIDLARADVDSAQLNLQFTRITAPFAGKVSRRLVSIGSLVSGGPGATASTPLTSIVSLDPIHLDFDMSEADHLAYQRFLALKQQGFDNTVQVSLSDERGWSRQGSLTFIDNQVDRGSGTLHARATVPNPSLLIAPGQFARLQVPVSAPRPVMLVPDAALVTDQSRKLLMVVDGDGAVVPRPVEIGALEGEQLRVITSGIEPTDRVIVSGLMRAKPGAKVTPKPIAVLADR